MHLQIQMIHVNYIISYFLIYIKYFYIYSNIRCDEAKSFRLRNKQGKKKKTMTHAAMSESCWMLHGWWRAVHRNRQQATAALFRSKLFLDFDMLAILFFLTNIIQSWSN